MKTKDRLEEKRKRQLEQRKEVQKWFDGFRKELLEWTHITK